MSDERPPPEPDEREPAGHGAAERAARLRAMGGVLRDASGDETPDGWGEPPGEERTSDAAWRREVPPHHGG